MKICSKCKQEFPTTSAYFHKWTAAKDGLRSRCKQCRKLYDKKYYHTDRWKQHRKKYRQTAEGKAEAKRSNLRARARFPKKFRAREITAYAVRLGKLKSSIFCESCGLPIKTEAHHRDYAEPSKIDWLYRNCHVIIHKKDKNNGCSHEIQRIFTTQASTGRT